MTTILTSYLIAALSLLQLVRSQGDCPEGWTKWKDEKCYSLNTRFLSYEDAQQVCATHGGLLVTVKEEDQQAFLSDFIFNVSVIELEVWIGATRVSPTEFQWEDGTPVDYNNWAPESPSHIDGRGCVVMQSINSRKDALDIEGTWKDVACAKPYYFACESESVWSPEDVKKVLVETRKKLNILIPEHETLVHRHEDAVAKLENLVQNPVPIGFIYTQLPGEPFPSSLWPNINWTEISEKFGGKFFRVVGNASAAFGTTQDADSPRLTGGKSARFGSVGTREVTILPGSWSSWLYTALGGSATSFNHLSFHVSNPEIRPINTAIRIWARES